MNPFVKVTALTLLSTHLLSAQNVKEEPRIDPVQDAIEAFANRDKKPNEVIVILEPPAPVAPVKITPPAEPAAPVKVTGNFPQDARLIQPETPPAETEAKPLPSPAKAEPELTVRVEKLQTGKGKIDPSKVILRTPYPAKPLSATPPGWRLDTSGSAPPFTREVEVAPGSKITLTISPHLMIPEADGANVFSISEPGYDNTLGFRQDSTVSSILSNSIEQLDKDSSKLSTVVDRLQQLLVTLPKPEPQPSEIAQPRPAPTPTTSRKK